MVPLIIDMQNFTWVTVRFSGVAMGNRVNVPLQTPKNLQKMENSSRLNQQWASIEGEFKILFIFWQFY